MRLNLVMLREAVVRTLPKDFRKPQDPFMGEPEMALESSHELEDLIEDVLEKMPRIQARVVRLAFGLTAQGREMTPAEISGYVRRSEAEVMLLLTGGLQILGLDDKLNEVFKNAFVH